jgi:hypothetical protein
MSKPQPPKGRLPQQDPPKKATAPPPARSTGKPAKDAPKLNVKVRYYARARWQRVYPLVVEARGPAQATTPLVLRPLIPGANVVPAELKLEPGKKASFDVTPLARGKLVNARLEVQPPGKPAVTIPLKIRSVTQGFTWLLLLLSFLIPGLLFYYTVYAPLTGEVPRTIPAIAAVKDKDPPAADPPPGSGPPTMPPPAGQPAPGGQPAPPPRDDGPAGPNAPAGGDAKGTETITVMVPMNQKPGWILTHRLDQFLKKNVPEIPYWKDTVRPEIVAKLNSWEEAHISPVESGSFAPERSLTADLVGAAYQFLCEGEIQEFRPTFILFVLMLMVTGWSWARNLPRRTSAKKGLDLGAETADVTQQIEAGSRPSASPPPPNPGRPAPISILPAD